MWEPTRTAASTNQGKTEKMQPVRQWRSIGDQIKKRPLR